MDKKALANKLLVSAEKMLKANALDVKVHDDGVHFSRPIQRVISYSLLNSYFKDFANDVQKYITSHREIKGRFEHPFYNTFDEKNVWLEDGKLTIERMFKDTDL